MSAYKQLRLSALALILWALMPVSAAQAQVAVTSADPAAAPQGTISLDVTISGSGFDSSATVDFLVTGTTNPGGITVKKVVLRGSKKLIATIDVADTAVVDKFDIAVTLSGGRKGKGTSLFAVVAKGSNDPCAAPGIDFPAFTFRGPTEATEEQIYVADANGTCIRPVYMVPTGAATDAATAVFSYPVVGTSDVGRIVWLQGSDRLVYGLSFLVTGTTVTPYSVELLHERVGAHIAALDMSPDGSTVYIGLDAVGPADSSSIIAITFSDHSYRDVYVGPADSSDVISITVDESGALFVTQADEFSQILRIDPGCATPSCATVIAATSALNNDKMTNVAASLVDDRLVYEHSGITACSPVLQVTLNAGGPVLNTAQPMYGRRSSWYGGKILTNGFKVNKRGCTISGTISRFDPDTGAETILVRGYDPDGR